MLPGQARALLVASSISLIVFVVNENEIPHGGDRQGGGGVWVRKSMKPCHFLAR